MKLSTFVDFYAIEAVRVAISDDKTPLLHSHAKLAMDIEYEHARLSDNFAHLLMDYLWLASLGEARWAQRSATFYTPSLTNDGGSARTTAYRKFRDFPPTEENIKVLEGIFFDRWYTGSYGGEAWGNIARCARLYKLVPHSVFIDTVASIRHNGGLAFNKSEASGFMDMQFDVGGSALSILLETKMRAREPLDLFDGLSGDLYSYLSHVTHRLLRRFIVLDIDQKLKSPISNGIAKCERRDGAYLDDLSYTPVVWGERQLKPVIKISGRRSYADDSKPCGLCGTPTNIDFLHIYEGKHICNKCIKGLGLIKCQCCGVFVDSNSGRKCGCGTNHCANCHRTCQVCGAPACIYCTYGCSTCNFTGCKNCYRINHNEECYYCGDTVCGNAPEECGKMACGLSVCSSHYAKHMARCYTCNPPTCSVCKQETRYKCGYCNTYCCENCLKKCSYCGVCACHKCIAKFATCSECNKEFCWLCATMSCNRKLCNGELACNKCYKQHHEVCATCGTIKLCTNDNCLNEASACTCGATALCKQCGYTCNVCLGVICEQCIASCKYCGNVIHEKCAYKSKCGALCCSEKCVKYHNSKCKAANQTCSCGLEYEHAALLSKCACGKPVCDNCMAVCHECDKMLCAMCSHDMVKANCGTSVCSQTCADKHNAVCDIAYQNSIPNFIEVDKNAESVSVKPNEIKVAIKSYTALFDKIFTTPIVNDTSIYKDAAVVKSATKPSYISGSSKITTYEEYAAIVNKIKAAQCIF